MKIWKTDPEFAKQEIRIQYKFMGRLIQDFMLLAQMEMDVEVQTVKQIHLRHPVHLM